MSKRELKDPICKSPERHFVGFDVHRWGVYPLYERTAFVTSGGTQYHITLLERGRIVQPVPPERISIQGRAVELERSQKIRVLLAAIRPLWDELIREMESGCAQETPVKEGA